MRKAFIEAIIELAERDARVLLLTADLGYTVLEPFAKRFPERFFNVGVAEQNMIAVACGLAEGGFVPYAYSIATFAVLRPYEFVRNGPIAHRLPVRIVGVGGGFEYGHDGLTHHALEDVAVMRAQPGITVIAPADAQQARSVFLATSDLPGPVYYRIGKSDKETVPGLGGRFELGRVEMVRDGADLVMLAMGPVAREAVMASDMLARRGVACAVGVVSTLNPPPYEDLAGILANYSLAMTVEAHYLVGGLGSLVSETVAERGLPCRVLRRGIASSMHGVSGDARYLLDCHGLSCESLTEAALGALQGSESVV